MILLGAIALICIISIIIVKFYYKDKEENEQLDLEEELGIKQPSKTKEEIKKKINKNTDFKKEQDEEIKRFSINVPSKNNEKEMFEDYYEEPINSKFAKEESEEISTLDLDKNQNDSNITEETITPQNESKEKTKHNIQEIENIIGDETETISISEQDKKIATKITQVPMTSKQKSFINESKKGKIIIDENSGSGIKIVKTNDAKDMTFGEITKINIDESKSSLEFKEKIRKANDDIITPIKNTEKEIKKEETQNTENTKEEIKKEETQNTENEIKENSEIVEKDIRIEETIEELLKESNIEKTPFIEETIKEIVDKNKEPENKTKTPEEENKETQKEPENKIKTPEEEIEETKIINKNKEQEEIIVEVEKQPSEEENTEKEIEKTETQKEPENEKEAEVDDPNKTYIEKLPKFKEEEEIKTGETTLDDHYHKGYVEDIPNADSLETKEEKEEIEGVITPIYQTKSALSGAVKSLKGLRDNLFNNENNDEEYDETEAEEFFNNPYETYDDFVSITPLTEEEIKAELAEESAIITPIEEEEIIYKLDETPTENDEKVEEIIEEQEETKKEEAQKEIQKLREKNTEKIFPALKTHTKDVEVTREGIEKIEVKNDQVLIGGEVYELKKGKTVIFDFNNESYSSTILATKPNYIGVRYRGKNLWIKNSRIKKVLKY